MIDEFFGDFGHLATNTQKEFKDLINSDDKESVWISMSNWYYGNKPDFPSPVLEDTVVLEDLVKIWFQEYYVVKMSLPLRSSSNIIQNMQKEYSNWKKDDFNVRLFKGKLNSEYQVVMPPS